MQVGRLLHDVLSGQLVAALLQHLHRHRGERGTGDIAGIQLVAIGQVFVHEGGPLLEARIVFPLRVAGVLQIEIRDEALAVFEAGWLQRRADRRADAAQNVERLPFDLGRLAD